MDDPALQAAARSAPRLVHAVARTTMIEMVRWGLINCGLNPGVPIAAERDAPAGLLKWRITVRDDGRIECAGALPTLIEWQGPHPCDRLPASPVVLRELTLRGLPAPDADWSALQVGAAVTAQIDWRRRHRHMRFHTATHLLCALVPHPVDGCSITADYARLDFHMTEPLDKAALTQGLARLVAESHAVSHRWISEAELDANPGLVRSMSVQPPRGLGTVRVMAVDGVDLQPCGGTHVANTAEIGAVVVTKIEKKSAKTRRVVLGFAAPA